MSRVGRLLLWVKAPRSLRHFNTLCRTPIQAQDRLLRQILEVNAGTEFGRRHGFGAITSFQQFQERVPISTYQDLEPYITEEMNGRPNQLTKEPPVLFTTTSGTTGNRKYIPMTRESKQAKSHLTWLWFCGLYRDHPGIVGGRILSVVSPEVESHAPSGVPCGAESGHAYRTMPGPVRSMYTAPYGVFAIEDYEAKYYTLLRLAAGQNISCIATVNPSTVLLLGDRLAQHTESIIRDVRDGSLSSEFSVPQDLRASLHLRPDPERARHLSGRPPPAVACCGPGWRGRSWPRSAAGREEPSAPTWRSSTPTSRRDRRSETSATTRPSCGDRCRSATRATPGRSRSAPTCSSSIPPERTAPPKAGSCCGSSSWRPGSGTSST
jgi:hypothetical protein